MEVSDKNIICKRIKKRKPFTISNSVKQLSFWLDQLGPSGTSEIANALLNNQSITSFAIKGDNITDLTSISNLLLHNTTLTNLNLSGNSINDFAANAEFFDSLAKNTTLLSLDLHSNLLQSHSMNCLSNCLAQNSTLTSLYLYGNNISKGAIDLASMIERNYSLTVLDICNSQIQGEESACIAKALEVNVFLRKLEIQNNPIGDVGATAFAKMLTVNSTLISLNLSSCNISTSGANKLGEALESNNVLHSLKLHNNPIFNSAKDYFKKLVNLRSDWQWKMQRVLLIGQIKGYHEEEKPSLSSSPPSSASPSWCCSPLALMPIEILKHHLLPASQLNGLVVYTSKEDEEEKLRLKKRGNLSDLFHVNQLYVI
eukprot:TRINITY_DN4565_c0_g1_i1.p1 TRINITY_DN4565_c0_g1~~TRINITY_DN4565_c0_g1_i1.p1  ORF type:complete len:371 (+),score=80.10 TRINITY_DN4565_c0_g1_i1:684-1796(+)